MSAFAYTARQPDGAMVSGQRQGDNAGAVALSLQQSGLIPVSVEPLRLGAGERMRRLGQVGVTKLTDADRIMLCRQLASLLKSGLPLARCLQCIADSTANAQVCRALRQVYDSVSAGQELALALRQQPKLFSPLAVSLVQAAEEVGRLDLAFEQICEHMQREQSTRRAVWTALRYPLVVLIGLLAAIVLINIFAVPAFVRVFARTGVELPLPTKILMHSSHVITEYGLLLLGLVAVLMVVVRLMLRRGPFRLWWDRWRMRLPVVSPIFHMCLMARLCRSLAMMMTAGVPLMRAITIAADVADNQYFRRRILSMREQLGSGDSLNNAARQTDLFSPLVLQMLVVGEDAGDMSGLLDRVGVHYETEASYRAEHVSSAVQPLLLGALAGLITLVALGVYLPMWSMMDGYL